MGLDVPVLQVVGYQNSGKTSVIEMLVSYFFKRGFKTATLKHHGHGGKPSYFDEYKDSGRHRKAGALASGVAGEGSFMLQFEDRDLVQLELLLDVYASLPIHLLLIEGYKHAGYEKIICVRDRSDLDLLRQCSNIVAVVSEERLSFPYSLHYPYFVMNDDQTDFLQFVDDLLAER